MDRRLIRLLYHRGLDTALARRLVRRITHAMPRPCITVEHYEISVRRLPPALDGVRILHVSDLHLRPGSEVGLSLPDAVAGHHHDLLVYTGDLIDSDNAVDSVLTTLARLPATAPAYAVFGDHDHWTRSVTVGRNDVARLQRGLEGLGVSVLCNESTAVLDGGLHLVGVDDPVTGRDDLERATANLPPDACAILLAHSPDILTRDRPQEVALVLAGHTHGGQLRLPLIGPVVRNWMLPRKFAHGLHVHGETPIFVNRGIGYSGVDIRIGCPPEAALLTLRSA